MLRHALFSAYSAPKEPLISQSLQKLTEGIPEFPLPFSAFVGPTGGRPSKLTPELMARLFELIQVTPIGKKHLCTLLGIWHQTCRNWELQGERDRSAGLETAETLFLDLLEKGQAYWRLRLMNAQLTGDSTWPKFATGLERLWPEEFGRRQEDSSAPKVVIQFGIDVKDVQINQQVNVIANYQTSNELPTPDSLCKPALTEGESVPAVVEPAAPPSRRRVRGARSAGGPRRAARAATPDGD